MRRSGNAFLPDVQSPEIMFCRAHKQRISRQCCRLQDCLDTVETIALPHIAAESLVAAKAARGDKALALAAGQPQRGDRLMDAQRFLAEFGHIANAPGGIARLRELILSLAFRGELCPHFEESVEELLISIERQRIGFNGETRKQKFVRQTDTSTSKLTPFDIPSHWCWVNLSVVGHTWGQQKPTKDFTYIDVSSIDNKRGCLARSLEVIRAAAAPSRARKRVKRGTLIYSTVRPYLLNIAIIDRDFEIEPIASTAFAIIHPWEGVSGRYLYFYLRSPAFIKYVESVQIGMAYPAVSDEKFYAGLIPLPPYVEQSRIVAKVDELMALCDKLEAQQQQRRTLQNRLRQATLQALAAAASPHELQSAWMRLEENFSRLFQVPEDVEEIRSLVMDLAVRGVLTEQNPNEGSAIHLLNRIKLEHTKLVEKGELKRQKLLPTINLANAPFELPKGWVWARFPEIGLFGRGKSKHRPRNDPKLFNPGIYPLVQTGEVSRSNGVIEEYHSKYSEVGLAQSKLWPKGTLCITIAANIADSAILGFDACIPDSVVGFIPALEIRDEVEYFLVFMKTARNRLLSFAPSTAQKNINLEILQSVLIPIPPRDEIKRILRRVKEINEICDRLISSLAKAQTLGKSFVTASVSSITGIDSEFEKNDFMKAPKSELIAPLRLGTPPNVKEPAPLASILAHHHGEMQAKDLWQRFGGEIDAFYAQLKLEVEKGWILEPQPAEMRQTETV